MWVWPLDCGLPGEVPVTCNNSRLRTIRKSTAEVRRTSAQNRKKCPALPLVQTTCRALLNFSNGHTRLLEKILTRRCQASRPHPSPFDGRGSLDKAAILEPTQDKIHGLSGHKSTSGQIRIGLARFLSNELKTFVLRGRQHQGFFRSPTYWYIAV